MVPRRGNRHGRFASMKDPDRAALLLRPAADEFRALAAMENPALFSDAIFGFHAHQVGEKTLKAWLSGVGVEYPRTHDQQGELFDRTRFLRLLQALAEDARSALGVQGEG